MSKKSCLAYRYAKMDKTSCTYCLNEVAYFDNIPDDVQEDLAFISSISAISSYLKMEETSWTYCINEVGYFYNIPIEKYFSISIFNTYVNQGLFQNVNIIAMNCLGIAYKLAAVYLVCLKEGTGRN